mmetsp:Transcript_49501/g.129139  ORF Transcript_49501/g.129139 Transcript_49501/m.129139 type:complete len:470 (-) Transcript_49501:1599-3008(-)
MATSVPVPTAMPTSAMASAGASLTPSPTKAILAPRSRNSCTLANLPAGLTPATTCATSTPASAAMCAAVRSLSPEIIHTCTPFWVSCLMTARASGLRESATAIAPARKRREECAGAGAGAGDLPSASAATPSAAFVSPWPSAAASRESATKTTVWPRFSRAATSASCSSVTPRPFSSIHERLPSSTARPSTKHCSPEPADATKSEGSTVDTLRSDACSSSALAIGCSLPRSAEPTARKRAASEMSAAQRITRATDSRPVVSVPVLSKQIVCTAAARSSTSPPLIRIPCAAPTPPPTMTAVGVARPRAHGHAITSTAHPNMKASSWSSCTRGMPMLMPSCPPPQPWPAPWPSLMFPAASPPSQSPPTLGIWPVAPTMAHAAQTSSAIVMTTGTKTAEILSANAWICGLRCCASATTLMICASVESAPTAVTSTYSTPEPLMVPPTTRSLPRLACGNDSPVIIDSSTADSP